jgi:hypothetical protein
MGFSSMRLFVNRDKMNLETYQMAATVVVCLCVCACVRACVRVCVRACVRVMTLQMYSIALLARSCVLHTIRILYHFLII